jgi:hypothetical protein
MVEESKTGGGQASGVAGAIIVYDLPSQRISAVIRDEKLRSLFSKAWAVAARLLKRNGINITQGVLVVPKEKVAEAEGAVRAVREIYLQLWKRIEEMQVEGLDRGAVEPLLIVIKLTDDQFGELRDVARRRFLESYGTVIGYLAEAAVKVKGVKSKEELKELRDGIYGRLAFFRARAFAVGSIFPEAELKLREVEEVARNVLRAVREAAQGSPPHPSEKVKS